jgi:amino acid transporter
MSDEQPKKNSAPSGSDDLINPDLTATGWQKFRRFLFGAPKNFRDSKIFHQIALIPFLAWVGLGADGLSSSAYGPEEAFRALGDHTYLAIILAALTALTVMIISAAYSAIIEEFPYGGGGYVVASHTIGWWAGLTSGSALVIDYVLTITISIAAAGDALFSFVPLEYHYLKLPVEAITIIGLTSLNIRGVKESITVMLPIFIAFIITFTMLIVGGILGHFSEFPATMNNFSTGLSSGMESIGLFGIVMLIAHAYSLGGGSYTGIEAVSNGLMIMREPRVQTGKRTMLYMAVSLAFMAGGLVLCYLLWNVSHVEGKTLNAVLLEKVTEGFPGGEWFVVLALASSAALLVVAAQAGFIAGPRVLANMAVDSWVPRRFASLSDRLTTQNGIVLMGAAGLIALLFTRGDVHFLVVMYSINVFLTFALSMYGMAVHTWKEHKHRAHWRRRYILFVVGFVMCALILGITVYEKFSQGGWITVATTGGLFLLCLLVKKHYNRVQQELTRLQDLLGDLPMMPEDQAPALDKTKPTAVVLVASYGGLGIHTVLGIQRSFPNYYKNLVFVSVAVIDSGEFKGEGAVEQLEAQIEASLKKYVKLANGLGWPASYKFSAGTDAVETAEQVCLEVATEFPRSTFFAGKVIFEREQWYQRLLHNETAFAIQKRLHWMGKTMVILPTRVIQTAEGKAKVL